MDNSIFRKLFFRNSKKKRCKIYLEHFREYKQNKLNRNIIVQTLPLLFVLVFFYILSSQNLYFGTVLSGSMEPTFERGDMVLMQKLYGEPGVGDIIMFLPERGGEPVTHRIVSVDSDGSIKTKGDANAKEDNWNFEKKFIIGKSVMIGTKPVVIKGLGSTLVSRAGEFSIMKEVTNERGIMGLFQEFRVLVPSILFFMIIFYIFLVIDASKDQNRMFGKKENNKEKK